jgi:4-hydroxy-tetrahydrodipicolinate reductase
VKYALVGYGRMGLEIERAASARGHRRLAVVDPTARGRGVLRRLDPKALRGAEVAFEFTRPETAAGNVTALLEAGIPVVCGTTGWDAAAPAIRRAVRAGGVAAVIAPNFSVGMNLFYRLVSEAARLYGPAGQYDPFVLEWHHRGKADAPSGTARKLGALILDADPRATRLQEGDPEGTIPEGAVHVASLRAGHEPGTHAVGFDGEHDSVQLTHRARGRAGFASGAVLAAEWVIGRRGIHGFDAVLEALLRAGRRGKGDRS